jgi:hypothetical protein
MTNIRACFEIAKLFENIFSFFSALIFPLVPVWIPTFSAGSCLFLVPALVPILTTDDD